MLWEAVYASDPVQIRYLNWLSGALMLNLGESAFWNVDVGQLLARKLPLSLQLGSMALIIGSTLGVAGGIVAALKPDKLADTIVRGTAVLGLSLPTFFTGMLLIIFLVRAFGWSPATGYIPLMENPVGNLSQLIWPALVVGLGTIMGTVLRITRASLMEAMASDYIRLARSKGMSERIIVMRHALPNAMIPIATVIGNLAPITLTGLILIEQVFGLPGVGRLLVDSIYVGDYTTLVPTVIALSGIAVVLVNLFVDVLYARLDPRIRFQGGHIA